MLDTLQSERRFDPGAATLLVDYLVAQREHTGRPLPHRHALLVEEVHAAPGGYVGPDDERQWLLHTLWGGRVNRPFALVLAHAFEARFGELPTLHVGDDLIALQVRTPCDATTLLQLALDADIDVALRARLEASPFFGARFRECAGRALLLAPRRFDRRQPLWLTRQTAKALLADLADAPDFPILLETWRTCLQDEFDLPALRARLDELARGAITWSHCRVARASPFGSDLVFDQVSHLMYADDAPLRSTPSALEDALVAGLGGATDEAPAFAAALVERYARRRARLEPGWLPADAEELAEWVRERVALADDETEALEHALLATHGEAGATALAALAPRLCWLQTGDGRRFTCARDVAPAWARASAEPLATTAWRPSTAAPGAGDGAAAAPPASEHRLGDDRRDAAGLVAELLAFHPPRPRAAVLAALPLPPAQASAVLDALLARGDLVAGVRLLPGATVDAHAAGTEGADAICTRDTFTTLLRMRRTAARERIEPAPLGRLPGFLAGWQGFGGSLEDAIAALSGFSAPAAAWEGELLPARVPDYAPHALDAALRAGDCAWRGTAERSLSLVLPEDVALLPEPIATGTALAAALAGTDPHARYDYHQLADRQALPAPAFSRAFWAALWGGALRADDFTVVREGIARDFELPAVTAPGPIAHAGTARRGIRSAARARARGWPGLFQAAGAPTQDAPMQTDALGELEQAKGVARLLLQRYGVLNRELFARERLVLGWPAAFRALRLMELAGEVSAAEFVRGLALPQFASTAAAARLAAAPAGQPFWCGATDPISPCGLGTEAATTWPLPLPRRVPGNLLVFSGDRLVATIEGRGRRLRLDRQAPEPALAACIPALAVLAGRHGRLRIAEIDGAVAADCPWLAVLDEGFHRSTDHRGEVELSRA
jgi:ATP-dependent Lhr-like helicase